MAKLTQAELKAHAAAQKLLDSDAELRLDQVADILVDWHEGATHSNAATSAFFTPFELAMNFAQELPSGGRVLDLCAGIGMLSGAAMIYHDRNPGSYEFTLVELDPAYCAVARRLLPNATIICGSIFDPAVQEQLASQHFDFAISNPPYGNKNVAAGKGPRYTGSKCEYAVIDIASDLADAGYFLIPQGSVPFRISGTNFMQRVTDNREYQRFEQATDITLAPNMGIDTQFAESMWRGTTIRTEITLCDFVAARQQRDANTVRAASGQLGFDLAA
jgi:hypothetical protein